MKYTIEGLRTAQKKIEDKQHEIENKFFARKAYLEEVEDQMEEALASSNDDVYQALAREAAAVTAEVEGLKRFLNSGKGKQPNGIDKEVCEAVEEYCAAYNKKMPAKIEQLNKLKKQYLDLCHSLAADQGKALTERRELL